MKKKTNYAEIRVTIKMVYPILIKVRAYTRIRLGKKENVRALIGRLFCPLCFFSIIKRREILPQAVNPA